MSGGTSNTEYKLVEPHNPTDPIVVFDPTIKQGGACKTFYGENDEGIVTGSKDTNMLDVDGVKVPIVNFNNSAIAIRNILDFKLSVTGFLPTLELVILDEDDKIKATDVPGMENNVTIILIAPVDGANKKIAMRFYITECNFNDDGTIHCIGEMKLPNLHSIKNIQLSDSKLSTYEMMEQIAKDNELGFAATEDCKDIDDKRWRQLYRQSTIDYVKEQLKFAGKDEASVFDAWVDQFGYLVLVNVSWVFNYDLDPFQLTIKTIPGIITGSKMPEDTKPEATEVVRLLTNQHYNTLAENLYFTKYEHKTNNEALKEGTNNKYYYMTGLCSENKIGSFETEIKEHSLDGQSEESEYTFENVEFIGFDFSEDDDDNTPIIVQQKNVDNFFANIYSKEMVVTMPKPNYLFQRGMLVIVALEEYNGATKKMLLESSDNVFASEDEWADESDASFLKKAEDPGELMDNSLDALTNKYSSATNLAHSGTYYIKDITFTYKYGDGDITQEMTLVKRGPRTNVNNKLTKLTTL